MKKLLLLLLVSHQALSANIEYKTPSLLFTEPDVQQMEIADLDGDGLAEIILRMVNGDIKVATQSFVIDDSTMEAIKGSHWDFEGNAAYLYINTDGEADIMAKGTGCGLGYLHVTGDAIEAQRNSYMSVKIMSVTTTKMTGIAQCSQAGLSGEVPFVAFKQL